MGMILLSRKYLAFPFLYVIPIFFFSVKLFFFSIESGVDTGFWKILLSYYVCQCHWKAIREIETFGYQK